MARAVPPSSRCRSADRITSAIEYELEGQLTPPGAWPGAARMSIRHDTSVPRPALGSAVPVPFLKFVETRFVHQTLPFRPWGKIGVKVGEGSRRAQL